MAVFRRLCASPGQGFAAHTCCEALLFCLLLVQLAFSGCGACVLCALPAPAASRGQLFPLGLPHADAVAAVDISSTPAAAAAQAFLASGGECIARAVLVYHALWLSDVPVVVAGRCCQGSMCRREGPIPLLYLRLRRLWCCTCM